MLIERYQVATSIALMIFVFSFSLSIITIEGNGIWLSQTIYNYTIPINNLDPSTPIPHRENGTRSYSHTSEYRLTNRYSEKNFDRFQDWGNFTINYSIHEIEMERIDKVNYPYKKMFYCTYDYTSLLEDDCGPMNYSTVQIVNSIISSSKVFIFYTLVCVVVQMILFGASICIKRGAINYLKWNIKFRFSFFISTPLSYISPLLFTLYFPESITDQNILVFKEHHNNTSILSAKYTIGPNLIIQYIISLLTTIALIIIIYSIKLFNQRNHYSKIKSNQIKLNNNQNNNIKLNNNNNNHNYNNNSNNKNNNNNDNINTNNNNINTIDNE